jgi:Fic family protein
MPLHEQAARLHHRAVAIHPFANGNGRWSRMLANIWLRRNGARWTEWPEATIGASSVIRGRYLDALRAADAGDLGPLTAMHAEFG